MPSGSSGSRSAADLPADVERRRGPYDGKHYQFAETICVPQPVQQPRPPIMIGGGGEKKTLRLVARYADACNLNVDVVEEVAHKLEVLRGHCDNEGRDYATIEKTMRATGEPGRGPGRIPPRHGARRRARGGARPFPHQNRR